MIRKSLLYLNVLLLSCLIAVAQDDLMDIVDEETPETKEDPVMATFKTTRLINTHTVKTLKERNLDVRITHRFDDIAGANGGISTFFGLDNVTDVRYALEYGVTDHLMVGFGRSKGAGPLKQNLDGFVKYRLLDQTMDNKIPVSVALMANTALTTMTAGIDSTEITYLPKFSHRISYTWQVLIARKFADRVALQVMPTYLHRNYVNFDEDNGTFILGVAGKIGVTQSVAIIFDYFYPFIYEEEIDFFEKPLGIGVEIETGGHVFHINFSNSPGIIENDYLPFTTRSWLDGAFRVGFTISRVFAL